MAQTNTCPKDHRSFKSFTFFLLFSILSNYTVQVSGKVPWAPCRWLFSFPVTMISMSFFLNPFSDQQVVKVPISRCSVVKHLFSSSVVFLLSCQKSLAEMESTLTATWILDLSSTPLRNQLNVLYQFLNLQPQQRSVGVLHPSWT